MISCLYVALMAFAMLTPSISEHPATVSAVPDRLVFRAVMKGSISTRHARAGTVVKMIVAAPETFPDGTVINSGDRLEGHVAESVPFSKDAGEARLSIVMDRLVSHHRVFAIHGFIVGQGQIRTRTLSTYSKGKTTILTGDSITALSPTLSAVEMLEVGNPSHDSYLVSRKKDIVLDDGMALLIRHSSLVLTGTVTKKTE